jgi:hypothetical protein
MTDDETRDCALEGHDFATDGVCTECGHVRDDGPDDDRDWPPDIEEWADPWSVLGAE